MEWLNDNSAAISALATIALTVLTAIYVWLTRKLVMQNSEVMKAAVTPLLSVRPIIDENFFHIFNLRIENVGGGPAIGVQLEVTNRPLSEPLRHLEKNGAFTNGIALLNSREKLEFFLASAIGDFDQLREHPIHIAASYKDIQGSVRNNSFVVDFREFGGFVRVGEPPLITLADNIKEIKETLRRLANGNTKLQVVASSPAHEEREGNILAFWIKLRRLKDSDREEMERLIDSKLGTQKDH